MASSVTISPTGRVESARKKKHNIKYGDTLKLIVFCSGQVKQAVYTYTHINDIVWICICVCHMSAMIEPTRFGFMITILATFSQKPSQWNVARRILTPSCLIEAK